MARSPKAAARRALRVFCILLVTALVAAIVFGIYWFAVKGRTWDDLKALFAEPSAPPATVTIETG